MAMALMAALPSICAASTSASVTAQTFGGTTTSSVTDSHVLYGAAGQVVQTDALASTFEVGQVSKATAHAYAAEGILQASVATNAFTTGLATDTGRGQSYATARWDDSLTINAGSILNGSKGYVTAQINVSGSYSGLTGLPTAVDSAEHFEQVKILGTGIDATSTSSAYGCGGWSLCDYEDVATWGVNSSFHNIPVVIALKIPVTFGYVTNLTYVLDLTDLAWTHSLIGGTGISAVAFADYAHTMAWGGITGVYDASGALLSSFTISSASGFNYLNAVAVPEPEGFALLLAGLGLLTVVATLSEKRLTGGPGHMRK